MKTLLAGTRYRNKNTGIKISSESIFPMVKYDQISLNIANECLKAWGHRMGPLRRGNQDAWCHALIFEGRAVAVTTASYLIAPRVGGAGWLTRENAIELSRLCANRPSLCRVVLRLWREFVFPSLGFDWAISYQDADLHTGNIYRFDGWRRVGYTHSGRDTRSGRQGRNKYVWVWPPPAADGKNGE